MSDTELIAFTQALVRCPSFPGEEGEVTALVTREMEALGYDRVWVDGNGSAVGIIGAARSGPTLLLDAHTDTVPIAPGLPWRHDPFAAEIEDSVLGGDWELSQHDVAAIEVLLQAIQQPQTEHVVRFMAPSLVVRSSARVDLS